MVEELHQEYLIGEEIGRGRFGVVHRCSALSTGNMLAVKSIDKSQLLDAIDREGVELEATLACLASIDNPGVVPVHAVYKDSESIHLVMELCDGPDLLEWLRIRPKPQVSEPEAAVIMTQLMQTLETCHKRGIAHRDVKPDNILFDRDGRVRLSDFGSAAWFGTQNGMEQRMSGIVGTPCYVAPEVLRGGEYDEKIDVWSAGVVMYIMLSGGAVPFGGDTTADVFGAVLRGNLRFPLRIFEGVSASAKDLMRRMICRDASRRFAAEQVLRHPWIVTGGTVVDTT
ncbi:phosphoenolpyruvate carboxylase kinase 2-like [Carex rostrata]